MKTIDFAFLFFFKLDHFLCSFVSGKGLGGNIQLQPEDKSLPSKWKAVLQLALSSHGFSPLGQNACC